MAQRTASRNNERRYLSSDLNIDTDNISLNIDGSINGVDLEDLEKQRNLLLKQLANTL